MHALVTIHDVMPETLERVDSIIAMLPSPCRDNLVLLVVPGRNWQTGQLDTLQRWQAQGIELAGHGWTHQTQHCRGFYHRLHALLISRNAAEHLALSPDEVIDLMHNCHDWFGRHGFGNPEYYVPPAWALGFPDKVKLKYLPWRYLEVTRGIHDLRAGQFRSLPLCGFEADSVFRAGFLTLWNGMQSRLGSPARPVRMSLHPDDPELKVAGQMRRLLNRVEQGRNYRSLF